LRKIDFSVLRRFSNFYGISSRAVFDSLFPNIKRTFARGGNGDINYCFAVLFLKAAFRLAVRRVYACVRVRKGAFYRGTEIYLPVGGGGGGNARNVFIKERGNAGEHMMVAGTAAVPTFSEEVGYPKR